MKNHVTITYVPNCLRKFRRARGLKTKDVAAILGLTSGVLSRWEAGVSLPDTRNALRLAALYRTFVDALFSDLAHDLKHDLRLREEHVLVATQAEGADPPPIDIDSSI